MPRPGGRPREPRITDIATHPRPHVSLRVAADYLKLHEKTVRARIEDGRLIAVRDGLVWRIPLGSLVQYQAQLATEAASV